MIKRALSGKLKKLASKFPVVAIIGPRQSGKTTLVKSVFKEYEYISLEDLDTRDFATNDPRGFLSVYKKGVIIDEVQRVPSLFSYIQTIVDKNNRNGQFILTGSQNFLLHDNISQTLAGRIALLKLLPFSLEELKGASYKLNKAEDYIFKGFYPRIYDKNIAPLDWYPNYIQTYVERDVRAIKNIPNLNTFQKFIKMCAGRTGQVVNMSSLGNDCGITHNTVKSWLSVLESSYIIFLLRPHLKNFNKRLVKMPKLYFYDVGLACSLLGIEDKKQLATHYLIGGLFESLIISELIKNRLNEGLEPNCYYWRDKAGNEVDCIVETAGKLVPVEIKSGKTVTGDFFSGMNYWRKLSGEKENTSFIVYGGKDNQNHREGRVIGWNSINEILKT